MRGLCTVVDTLTDMNGQVYIYLYTSLTSIWITFKMACFVLRSYSKVLDEQTKKYALNESKPKHTIVTDT